MTTKTPQTSMSKSAIASAYGISLRLLKIWIVEMYQIIPQEEYIKQRVFTPKQVQKIYNELGDPAN
jgi:hypothetical protein